MSINIACLIPNAAYELTGLSGIYASRGNTRHTIGEHLKHELPENKATLARFFDPLAATHPKAVIVITYWGPFGWQSVDVTAADISYLVK